MDSITDGELILVMSNGTRKPDPRPGD